MVSFAVILFVVLMVTAKISRRHTALFDRKRCRKCSATFAPGAKFCGRCGKSL